MSGTFSIELSPFQPPYSSYGELVFAGHLPYDNESIALIVNPNITDYNESDKDAFVSFAQQSRIEATPNSMNVRVETSQPTSFAYGGKNYNLILQKVSNKEYSGEKGIFKIYEFFIDESDLLHNQKEGSLTPTISHPNKDWVKDNNVYDFKPIKASKIMGLIRKNSKNILELMLNGPLGENSIICQDLSKFLDEKELFIALTWKDDEILLYINGELVQTHKK